MARGLNASIARDNQDRLSGFAGEISEGADGQSSLTCRHRLHEHHSSFRGRPGVVCRRAKGGSWASCVCVCVRMPRQSAS